MSKMSKNQPFVAKIVNSYGDAGQAWLDSLPSRIGALCNKWELSDVEIFDNLSYNYVFKAFSITFAQDVVVKISFDKPSLVSEFHALKQFDGNGCVRAFDYDKEYNAFVMECLSPGAVLSAKFPEDDLEATRIAARLIEQLNGLEAPAHEYNFRRVEDMVKILWDDALRRFVPECMLLKAQKFAQELIVTQAEQVLLHGDLHHDNILFDTKRDWCAIDPKGCIGERAYEVGAFMRNPFLQLADCADAPALCAARLDIFSRELGIARERLWQWCFVNIILAACWSAQARDKNVVIAWLKIAAAIEVIE